MKVLLRMRKTSPRLFLQPCGSSSSSSSGSSSGGGSQGRDLASQWEYGSFKYGVFGFNDSTTGTTTGRRYTPNPSPTPNRDQSVATAEEREGVDRSIAATEEARRALGGMLGNLTSQQVERGVETLRAFVSPARLQKLSAVLEQRSDGVRVVFENPSNPNNVWAALRTCDAFGVHSIGLVGWRAGQRQVWRRDQMNAALGAQKFLSISSHDDEVEAFNSLRQRGYKILVTDVNPKSKSLFDYDFDKMDCKIAIVFGNELTGATVRSKTLADDTVFLPMRGFAESLNLSVSVAVALTHLRSKGLMRPNIGAESKNRILLGWLCSSVRASLLLLQRAGLPVESTRMFDKFLSGEGDEEGG